MNYIVIIIFSVVCFYCNSTENKILKKNDYGMSVYKKANCMGCHSWHGKGGGGYGAGSSLRETVLDLNEIKFVINCGILGTGMPYFNRNALDGEQCYEKEAQGLPTNSKTFLNNRQINAVAAFINDHLKGQNVTHDYCKKFFGSDGRICERYSSGVN